MEIIPIASYSVSILAGSILAAYFFREYFAKRLRASLAWAAGLLLYVLIQVFDLIVQFRGEAAAGKPILVAGFLMLAFAMSLLYYGTSLLFFSPGSFFREKMTAVIMFVYFVVIVAFSLELPLEGFRAAVTPLVSIGVLFPIKVMIAALFYRVFRRLEVGDPRKQTVLLLASGWGLDGLSALLLWLIEPASHAMHAIAWIMILYGMTMGKVTK